MSSFAVIVVGASAGGLEPLRQIIQDLPVGLPAAVLVVLHIGSASALPAILSRTGSLSAHHPVDGEALLPGRIYVAPPDLHLIVEDERVYLRRDPQENGHRPAIDPLFRSASLAYGPRTIGVVLSGALDDGAVGLALIKHKGGIAIVQDPDEAMFDSMPRSVLDLVDPDWVLPAARIGGKLGELADELVAHPAIPVAPTPPEPGGPPSEFSCPACGGVLWENPTRTYFRCRIGHAFNAESLLAKQSEALETILRSAERAFAERADLNRRIAERSRRKDRPAAAAHYAQAALQADEKAAAVRQLLGRGQDHSEPLRSAERLAIFIATAAQQLAPFVDLLSVDFDTAAIAFCADLPHCMHHPFNGQGARPARDGEPLRPGCLYTLPAHRHLLVNPDRSLALVRAELADSPRPSLDLLLCSAAASYGERLLVVQLSGEAGVRGRTAVSSRGGTFLEDDRDDGEQVMRWLARETAP